MEIFLENEIKIIKKKDGNYKTPSYVRKAVRDYEKRMKEQNPEKYQQRLNKHKEYYQQRKLRLKLALEESLLNKLIESQ